MSRTSFRRGSNSELAAVIQDVARSHAPPDGKAPDLIADSLRVHGVLRLEPSEEFDTLLRALGRGSGALHLSRGHLEAYITEASRVQFHWSGNDPLEIIASGIPAYEGPEASTADIKGPSLGF